VRAEGIHLTLKFLGEVDEWRQREIEAALAGSVEPFDVGIRPAKLGGFGGGRLRVIWVGLEGDLDELGQLARVVERALAPVGFEEDRPFTPHLTLARVPDRLQNEQRRELSEVVKALELPAMPTVRLSQVSLIRSVLGPGGARYRTISRYPAGPS
jgi:2'-5' RNA ligase